MPGTTRWRRGTTAGLAVLAVAAFTTPAVAQPVPPEADRSPLSAGGYDLTLITGDQVHVTELAGGRKTATVTAATRANGGQTGFVITEDKGELTVVPDDVSQLIPDRLDPALFNVTQLARDGHAEGPLPVVVTYRGAPTPLPATTVVSSAGDSAALSVDRTKAPELGAALAELAKASPDAALSTIGRVRLDRATDEPQPTADAQETLHELRVSGIARDGREALGGFTVLGVNEGNTVNLARRLPGTAAQPCSGERSGTGTCLLVPAGTYSVLGHIRTMPGWQPSTTSGTPLNLSFVGDPQVEITGNTEIVLDARKATEVLVQTPEHETKRSPGAATHLIWSRTPVGGKPVRSEILLSPHAMLEERLFLQPTERVTVGEFEASTRWRLEAPDIQLKTVGWRETRLEPQYFRPVWFSDYHDEFPRLDGRTWLGVADAGQGRPEDLAGRDLRGKLALIRRTDGMSVAAQSNTAAAAGARLVAIYNDQPGVNADPGGSGTKLLVPTVRLSQAEGENLLAMARRGPVLVEANGEMASPYLYDLIFREESGIPEALRYVARTRSLTRVDNDYHTQLADGVTISESRYAFGPGAEFAVSTLYPLARTPRSRVDYVSPDPRTEWTTTAWTPDQPYNNLFPHIKTPQIRLMESETVTYQPGQRRHVGWFKHPLVPGVSQHQPVHRERDTLRVSMQGFVDANGNFGTAYTNNFENGFRTDFRLYQGDKLLKRTTSTAAGSIQVSPEPGEYRIEYDIANDATWSLLSTRTRTVWTFGSGRTAEGATEVLPLLFARYDPEVDLHNRATNRGRQQIEFTLGHQPGAGEIGISAVSLDVSFDDGASWQPVERLRTTGGGRYTATFDQPRPEQRNGFVSLRLRAQDQQGNSLAQEVIRGYALK